MHVQQMIIIIIIMSISKMSIQPFHSNDWTYQQKEP